MPALFRSDVSAAAPGSLTPAGRMREMPTLPRAVSAALWRGDQLGRTPVPTRSSGFAALDAELPGGGWPCQGLTELLCHSPGTLAWRLLAPLLRTLSPTHPVMLVGPPHRPHPPGLRADGIAERHLVWLRADTVAERLWTAEQLLKAGVPGVLIVWLPEARPEPLRRLQVWAGAGQGPVFVCRPQSAACEASAAPLRLRVGLGVGATGEIDPWTLWVDLFKRPGPPLAHTLHLPSPPCDLAALLPPRLSRAPGAVSCVPTSVREDDHVVVRSVAARAVRH